MKEIARYRFKFEIILKMKWDFINVRRQKYFDCVSNKKRTKTALSLNEIKFLIKIEFLI